MRADLLDGSQSGPNSKSVGRLQNSTVCRGQQPELESRCSRQAFDHIVAMRHDGIREQADNRTRKDKGKWGGRWDVSKKKSGKPLAL